VRPNPPMYCEGCGERIPNRKDRKTPFCRRCVINRRCAECGQVMAPDKEHRCASVDLRGDRFCNVCGVKLRNEGYERQKRTCPRCMKMRWRDKERTWRAEAKRSFGGKCSACGYARCQAALHFHHVNGRLPESKRGSVRIQEVRAHPERFALLCANCHIELHNPGE